MDKSLVLLCIGFSWQIPKRCHKPLIHHGKRHDSPELTDPCIATPFLSHAGFQNAWQPVYGVHSYKFSGISDSSTRMTRLKFKNKIRGGWSTPATLAPPNDPARVLAYGRNVRHSHRNIISASSTGVRQPIRGEHSSSGISDSSARLAVLFPLPALEYAWHIGTAQ